MMFLDRTEAGRRLAEELKSRQLRDPVVLALPRGGVPVAAEIAVALDAPLDVLVVRKVGAPDNPELAVAAIVDGDPPDVVLNREIVEAYGLTDDLLQQLVARERPELERRRMVFAGDRKPYSVRGKTAILVDDGVATGTSVKVALRALARRGPRKVVLAVPVGPPDVLDELAIEADEVVCLSRPGRFRALSLHYREFPQLTDEEVLATLAAARAARKAGSAAAMKSSPSGPQGR